MDGETCTDGVCDGAGSCQATIQPGSCLIGSTCRADGEISPANECRYCDAAAAQTQWTYYPDGTPCTDEATCTTGTCQQQSCTQEVEPLSCYIQRTCYLFADPNPADACQVCSPPDSQQDWTDRAEGAACGTGCTCESGACLRNNGTPC